MTKAQIVDLIAHATGLTKLETEAVVDGFMHTVLDAVAEGDRVELRGFGTFRSVERAPRTARNPRTDQPVPVPSTPDRAIALSPPLDTVWRKKSEVSEYTKLIRSSSVISRSSSLS